MQFVRPDIQTTCVGLAVAMGALLLEPGRSKRRAGLAVQLTRTLARLARRGIDLFPCRLPGRRGLFDARARRDVGLCALQ